MTLWNDMSAYEQPMGIVAVKLAIQSRWSVRKYGGFAEGVRRDLSVTKYIAENITERMTFAFRRRNLRQPKDQKMHVLMEQIE